MDQKNLSLKFFFFDEWEKFDESEKLDSLPPNPRKEKINKRTDHWRRKIRKKISRVKVEASEFGEVDPLPPGPLCLWTITSFRDYLPWVC